MSEPWLRFNPILPFIVSIGLLLLSVLAYILIERNLQQKYPIYRICAYVIMTIALAGIILRPSYPTEKSAEVLLLTANYDANRVDSVLQKNPKLTVLRLPAANTYPGSSQISYNALGNYPDNIKFIVGDGLPLHTFQNFSNAKFTFLKNDLPEGILNITGKDFFVDKRNTITGVIKNGTQDGFLILEGPAGKEDSVVMTTPGIQPFALSFNARQAGNFLYRITYRNQTGKEEVNHYPVSVRNQPALRILIIQHYPTFEMQYLKNFLAKKNAVVLRYQLSKSNYRYEFNNHPSISINKLDDQVLNKFDLVLIDTDALAQLSASENLSIEKALDAGLGMIVSFNEEPARVKSIRKYLPVNFKSYPRDTVHIQLNQGTTILPAWPVESKIDQAFIPVIKNKKRALSAYGYKGFGKIGYQLLQETYRLTLEGDSVAYSAIWTPLIEKTARKNLRTIDIKLQHDFPLYADEPIDFDVIGNDPEITDDSVRIALQEDVTVDDVWHGTTWADKAGWHKLRSVQDSSVYEYYVSPEQEWRSLRKAQTILNTSERSSHPQTNVLSKSIVYRPISLMIFFVMFLLSSAVLWLTPKL